MDTDRITAGRIRLEASSACQLRCPSCPTTTGHTEAVVGKGLLALSDFKNLLAANPQLREIELSNYGEIFINPAMPAILAHAHANGVVLSCDNGANLNDVPDATLEAVVKYGLRSMLCSIDGASQEVYEKYRVRGTLATVLANIRRINDFKRQYRTQLPVLTWQFIVFPHNEHELPAAQALAAELGMGFTAKLRWEPSVREAWREQHGADYAQGICGQLWHQPQINWDGKVLGCCRNFWGEFGGNAFTDGLDNVVNSEPMRYARRMLLGQEPPRDGIPCTTCDLYRYRDSRQDWIEIRRSAPATSPATP